MFFGRRKKWLLGVWSLVYWYHLYITDPIQIMNIPDLNISQYTVGDALTVGCQVTTCASQVTLTISPSLAVQQESIIYMNTGENKVQNFVLTVNKNLAGTYMLTAEGKFSDGSVFPASQVFNIIG